MDFQFAKYTEITDFALKLNPQYEIDGYIRFFICPDVHDVWFVRILKDLNEDYDVEEGSFLLERNKIDNDYKGQELTMQRVRSIIEEDDMSNWDIHQENRIDELIDTLDNGFGIINLKK